MGDFVKCQRDSYKLMYLPHIDSKEHEFGVYTKEVEEDPEMLALKGTHSGLSKDEIMVPFIVIK